MSFFLTGNVNQKPIRISLSEGRQILGRSLKCPIRVDHPSVSRRHIEIVVKGESVIVTDLNSRNGTLINNVLIEKPTAVCRGDQIKMAGVSLRLTDSDSSQNDLYVPETDSPAHTALSWDEIRVPQGRQVEEQRDRFQVLVEAGELLAVHRPLDELFEAILDLVERTINPQRTLLLLSEDGADPVVKAQRFRGPEGRNRLMLSRTMVDQVMKEKASFVTEDVLLDSRFRDQESVIAQGLHSAMAAPLFDNETVIGLLYTDTADLNTSYTEQDLRTFGILANLSAVKITQARVAAMEEEQCRIRSEIEAARGILGRILPVTVNQESGYDLHAFWKPCLTVGGDLYDTQLLPDGRLAFLLGDVTGKGLGAAMLVSHIIPIVRLLAEELWPPNRIVSRLNRLLWRSTDSVHFATLFLGVLDPPHGRIRYVNGGHNPPLHLHRDGKVEAIDATGMAVGMFEASEYTEGELILQPGETVVLYTDGVTEAENPKGEAFEQERLSEILALERDRPPEELSGLVMDGLTSFCGRDCYDDDVTMLLIRRQVG